MYDVTWYFLTLGCCGNVGYCDTTEALQVGTEQRFGDATQSAVSWGRHSVGRLLGTPLSRPSLGGVTQSAVSWGRHSVGRLSVKAVARVQAS